ncbi:hypothetical protein L6452_19668 [Arctium lappa]|uniref:Uncharacterized protein n=1 Tax=Arctium lappa TaxID=4217 RepID=A0ACB9B8F5_ARCLA|nr:hypothetical protein L6452_19668 [Arctium lappa]
MAEEIQAAVCGGSWWMSPRTTFNRSSCSSVITDMENFEPCWPRDLMDMKSKSSDDDQSSDGSMVFQDIRRQPGGGTTTMSPDSAFEMMATAFSDSPMTTNLDWDQNFLFRVQEGLNTFSTSGDGGSKAVTAVEPQLLDQQQSINFIISSGDCTTFPISSTSYDYSSSLLETLYDSSSPPPPPPPPQPQPPQQPLYSFQSNSNDFSFVQSLSSMRPKQQVSENLHLTNNTPFWNASTSTLDDNISSFSSSPPSQFLPSSYKEKQSCPNLIIQPNLQETRDSGSTVKKSSGELPFKRPRLDTPSPLPTFKVRKEKLGDRITALQQLVSPFGKILSAPYMKNGATKQLQEIHDYKVKDAKGRPKQDLRSLGLCLMPVSSTFPIATEMMSNFWTPNFEGSFR